jgi:hypothetical protein
MVIAPPAIMPLVMVCFSAENMSLEGSRFWRPVSRNPAILKPSYIPATWRSNKQFL